MSTFRDASVGVWCISWHPESDDVWLEPLSAVVRNNLVACPGQHKAVLSIVGHRADDMLTLRDADGEEHHGLGVDQACAVFRDMRHLGQKPAFYPASIESAERWQWITEG